MKSLLLQGSQLTYFGIPGRGEATRLALTIGGVENWKDHRIEFSEWPALKQTTPWGSLPLLTLSNGTVIAQQRAILRLVGKETGLYPSEDTVQAALVDSLMDACEDVGSKINAQGQGLEHPEKEAARAKAVAKDGAVYQVLQMVESFVAKYGKNGHAVGNTLTIADLYLYAGCGSLVSGLYDGVPTDCLETPDSTFSNINAVRKTVRSHPAAQAYYDKLDLKYRSQMSREAFGPFE